MSTLIKVINNEFHYGGQNGDAEYIHVSIEMVNADYALSAKLDIEEFVRTMKNKYLQPKIGEKVVAIEEKRVDDLPF